MEELAIECINLTKTFTADKFAKLRGKQKDKIAVSKLTFNVKKGEVYGLLGPNGAGKTTALRMLATLIKPDSGEIKYNGLSLSGNEIRKIIGFLTDELHLEDSFSANYYYNYFGKLYRMSDEKIEERKKDIFSRLGIDEFQDIPYGKLSTGMKQKVSLAVSIVHDPDIIIFDEPTNGLDIVASKNVIDFLLEMKKDGKTIILSTHIFSIVEEICDRVGIIINGKMATNLDVKEIIKESSLAEEFFKVYREDI